MGQKHKSWRRNSTKWRDITAEMFEEAASSDGDLIFRRRNLKNRKHVSNELVREAGPSWQKKREAGPPNPDLPSDIIYYQILPRLPDKSLIRFKCVRKSWLSLICSPFFFAVCKNFCHRRSTTNLLFHEFCGKFMSSQLDEQEYPTPVTELSDFAPSQFYWPCVQSISGLVCVSGDNRESRDYEVSIFNPTTKQCIKLPNAPMPKNNRYRPTYHFGFTPRINKYKVLQVALDDEERLMMNIFTLGRNSSWMPRHLNPGDLPFGHQNCLLCGSLPLNGAIHWINEDDKVIVVFDVEGEKFRVIALPDLHSGSPNFFRLEGLVDIEGFVAVWGHLYGDKSLERDRKSLVLFILKGYENDEWVTETINIESTTEDYVGDEWSFRPLCVIHTGELAVVVRPPCTSPGYDFGPSRLRLYNMKSKGFVQKWFEFPYIDNDDDSYNVYNRLGRTLIYTSFENSFVPLQ